MRNIWLFLLVHFAWFSRRLRRPLHVTLRDVSKTTSGGSWTESRAPASVSTLKVRVNVYRDDSPFTELELVTNAY